MARTRAPLRGPRCATDGIAEPIDAQRGSLRELNDQLQLAAERLHVATQGRQAHVGLALHLRYRWLLDVQCGCDIGLRLAGDLTQLAQAPHLLLWFLAALFYHVGTLRHLLKT